MKYKQATIKTALPAMLRASRALRLEARKRKAHTRNKIQPMSWNLSS
jgi:hypothetical protein